MEESVERLHARSSKGSRVYDNISGRNTHNRISIIAAYIQKKLVAPFRFKGYTNTKVFDIWVEKCLVPLLNKDHVVILDNATFHKSQETRKKIEATGARVIFLPPYSPDLNKIEPQWAVLKSRIRKAKYMVADFIKNLDAQLIEMGN
jgi:transposase